MGTLGAVTRDDDESIAGGNLFVDNIGFDGDDSYPTNGTPFDDFIKTQLGDARDVVAVISNDCGIWECQYIPGDDALGLLKVFVMSTGVEVANAVDMSGTTFNLTIISK